MQIRFGAVRTLFTAGLIAIVLAGGLSAPVGQARSGECDDQITTALWLQSAIPIYWLHHSFIGYLPSVDWESPSHPIKWASEQPKDELALYRDAFRDAALTIEEPIDPTDIEQAKKHLQETLLVTADILETLISQSVNDPEKIETEFEQLFSLVSVTDQSMLQLIDPCQLRLTFLPLDDDISCLETMVAYHGDWPRGYYGGHAYFFVNLQEARESLDNGDTDLAREATENIRRAATDLYPENAPSTVQDLVMSTDAAYRALADWLDAEADLLDGVGSQAQVALANEVARNATAEMDRQADLVFTPCDRIYERLFSSSGRTAAL
jgi:hypothetical protein